MSTPSQDSDNALQASKNDGSTAEETKQNASTSASDEVAPSPAKMGNQTVIFGNAFSIDLSERLEQYENRYVSAYKASGINGDEGSYFAIICPPTLTPRSSKSSSYARINGGAGAYLSGSGIINLPKTGQNYCFVFKDNLGNRIFEEDEGVAHGWKADQVLQKIVAPAVSLLKDMHEIDMAHGSMRLTNFYDGGIKNYETAMIGECLSLPPSLLQPAIYEPLHRCSAQPIGRGPGLIQDDLYALGVCIAMLMRTTDPMAGKTEEEIILHKLQHGTYTTLIHKNDRFTGAILELLRGLLIDDNRQRWTIDDVTAWLDGRRLSPKQTTKRKKASRQLTFRGNGYYFMEAFANDMFLKPSEAVNLIESDELGQWLVRSIEDKDAHERLLSAISSAQQTGRSSGYADRLLSRVAMALDPEGPIRYKDLSLRPDGIGYALGEAFIKNMNLQSFLDVLNSPLLQFWAVTSSDLTIDVSPYISKFEKCKEFINRPMIGYGLERCLYFLYPDIRCISPLLKGFYVRTPEDLLMAYDKMAAQNNKSSLFLDRHITAFLSVKDSKIIDSYLYDLNSSEHYRKMIGLINVFANIQQSSNVSSVPHLSEWICESIDPVIERYHDKKRRTEIRKKIAKLKTSGNIAKIVKEVDNPNRIRRDFAEFKVAMFEYKTLEREHNVLEAGLENPKTYGRQKGKQAGVIVSGVIASLIVMAYIIVNFGQNTTM